MTEVRNMLDLSANALPRLGSGEGAYWEGRAGSDASASPLYMSPL